MSEEGREIVDVSDEKDRGVNAQQQEKFAEGLKGLVAGERASDRNKEQLASRTVMAVALSGLRGSDKSPGDLLVQATSELKALGPQDPLELQIIGHLASLSEISHRLWIQAADQKHADLITALSNAASKSMSRYIESVKLLLQYRNSGQSNLQVNNINVTGNAQAVIAGQAVASKEKSCEGPHAMQG
jgi:hypothetical protein